MTQSDSLYSLFAGIILVVIIYLLEIVEEYTYVVHIYNLTLHAGTYNVVFRTLLSYDSQCGMSDFVHSV